MDIVRACGRIAGYLAGVSLETFEQDALRRDGVIRQITIIGEAVKRLSPEFPAAYASVPWKDIAGMRDVLVHWVRPD